MPRGRRPGDLRRDGRHPSRPAVVGADSTAPSSHLGGSIWGPGLVDARWGRPGRAGPSAVFGLATRGAEEHGRAAALPGPAPFTHPDHGAAPDGAAQRIADLTEARRILLADSALRWPAARPGALLLSPGPGGPVATHHTLVAIEEALAPLPVARVDFPYRKEGRQAPDRAPKLLAAVVRRPRRSSPDAACPGRRPRRPVDGRADVLDGRRRRAAGGRARAPQLPAAPAGQAREPAHRAPPVTHRAVPVRVRHQGPVRLAGRAGGATAAIPGPVTHVWIDGGRHDLKGKDPVISAAVREWIAAL